VIKKKLKSKILVVYELSKNTGKGHYGRAVSIYNVLRKIYINSRIISLEKLSKNMLEKYNYFILDFKNYNNKLLSDFKKIKKNVLTIENFQNELSSINISIYDHNKKLNNIRYSGLKFATIDEKLKRKILKKNRNIFIFLGASFNKKILLKKILNKFNNKNYKIYLSSLNSFYNFNFKNVKIVSQENWRNYFNRSHYCILNGGVTLLEALYLKKKCFVVPQTKKELVFSNYLLKKKYIYSNKINQIDYFFHKRKKMKNVEVANEIDKYGVNKIIKIFQSKIIKYD
tara:strand:- start:596 stop:1450 length:855 start_codon:yes stop_codon:yes gene_type:complete